MKKLSIYKNRKKNLYQVVKELTPHSDIYFQDHILLVANNCLHYGKEFEKNADVDPVLCEIAGLVHDIGYTKKYEEIEGDHITRGISLLGDLLPKFGITGYYLEKIQDCVYTHDGNLHRSKFKKNEPPLENIIVNDVDSMCLFEWPIESLIEFSNRLRSGRSQKEVIKGILDHANKTFLYIYHEYFKELAKMKYEKFVRELEKRK